MSPGETSARARVLWVLAVGAVVVFFLFNLGIYFDFTSDDPGISFRYGANLFDGRGLAYNPGERVEGYSNFGYVLLSGAIYKLLSVMCDARWYLLFAMKLVNLTAGIATGVLCYRFCTRILDRGRVFALLTVVLLAANGAYVINVSSPMETATYTLLITAMLYGLTRHLEGPSVRGLGLSLIHI